MDGSDGGTADQQVARYTLNCLLALDSFAPHVAVAVADAFLEAAAPAWPNVAPLFEGAQGEADWWAEFATGTMVVAMLSACLKRLSKGQMITAQNAKKRAMVAIWNSMTPEDKTGFLDYVQPPPGSRA